VPAWSPTRSVTPETLVWFALLVPVELADALLPAETDEEDEDDEQAAAVRVARLTAAATASVRRARLPGSREEPPGRRETRSVRFIIVLPC
jgi:hypothetical protein